MSGERLGRLEGVFCGVVGVVFLAAAVTKIPDPEKFVENIRNFRLVPAWALHPMALVLPWAELLAALCLIFGLWLREMVCLVAALSVAYEVGAIAALVRGINIKCGCFGPGYEGSAWSVITTNAALLVMDLVILWCHTKLRPGLSTEQAHRHNSTTDG